MGANIAKTKTDLAVFIAHELPINGEWWKESSRAQFIRQGNKLIDKGFILDEVKAILNDLYYATSAEFGS